MAKSIVIAYGRFSDLLGAQVATYNVWLANPTKMAYRWQELCERVHSLYSPTLAGGKNFDKVCVRSTMSVPSVGAQAVLIYILPSGLESLVGPLFKSAPGPDGLTGWFSKGVTASEVYVNSKFPGEVARLVFHEALHNTLHLKDEQLHPQRGLAGSPVGLQQTPNDVALMQRGMQLSHPQWQQGFEAANDPLNGL